MIANLPRLGLGLGLPHFVDAAGKPLYHSVCHWQKLVNGTSGFFPPSYLELLDHMRASEESFLEGIRSSQKISEEEEDKLTEIINHFKKGFAATGGGSVVRDEHVEAMDEESPGLVSE